MIGWPCEISTPCLFIGFGCYGMGFLQSRTPHSIPRAAGTQCFALLSIGGMIAHYFSRVALVLALLAALCPAASANRTAPSPTAAAIVKGARVEAEKQTPYIMDYKVIAYPGGDVPAGTGVCTDLVVRALRHAGIDLQKEVSEDRKARPAAYPRIWENHRPDRNIDHRRCPNLVAWMKKHAQELPVKLDEESLKTQWLPGDVVFYVREKATHPWHVGIVSDKTDTDGMPMIIDSFPPHTSESHRLDTFAPIHSHFRIRPVKP